MLRWMDGFEQYGSDEAALLAGVGGAAAWSEAHSNWSLSTANPATGIRHLRCADTAANAEPTIRRAVGQSKQVVGFGYRFNTADLPAHESYTEENRQFILAQFRDVANVSQCRVSLGTEGSVYAVRGDTFLGRSDPVIAPGGYHHFEAKTRIDNATGYVEVRINEVTVLNLTNIDTQNTGNAETSQIAVKFCTENFGSTVGFGTFDLDDAFLWDDDAGDPENTVVDFIGDKGCYYLPPAADTATSEWGIVGSATAYGAIDEAPPSGVDYLDDITGAARTIVGIGALPSNVSEVIAYMPVIYARKEESGTVEVRGGVVVGASESYAPTNSPSTQYAYMEPGPKTVDPSTGLPWDNVTVPDLLIERTA